METSKTLKVMDSQGLRDLYMELDSEMKIKFPDNKKKGIHIKEFLADLDVKRFYIQTDDEQIRDCLKGTFVICSSGVTMVTAKTQ